MDLVCGSWIRWPDNPLSAPGWYIPKDCVRSPSHLPGPTFMSVTASETLILVLLASLLSCSTYSWACCRTFIWTAESQSWPLCWSSPALARPHWWGSSASSLWTGARRSWWTFLFDDWAVSGQVRDSFSLLCCEECCVATVLSLPVRESFTKIVCISSMSFNITSRLICHWSKW